MSTTPGSKLSPFGNGIRKTLLTPCRRVGLSRKTKTPNNINKSLSQTPGSNTKLSDQQPTITPVNKNKTSIKRNSLVQLTNPLEKTYKLEDNVKCKSNAKKSLNECFSNTKSELKSEGTIPIKCTNTTNAKKIVISIKKCKKINELANLDSESKENMNIKDIKRIEEFEDSCNKVSNSKIERSASSAVVIETIAQIHNDSIENSPSCKGEILSEHDFHKNSICTEDTDIPDKEISKENMYNKESIQCAELESNHSAASTSSSPIVRKSHKNRILSDSDDDDDFTVLPTESLNESVDKKILNNMFTDKIRDCEMVSNLCEEGIEIIKNKSAKKKRACISSDDDDDFCPKSSTKIEKSMSERRLKSKASHSSLTKSNSGQNIGEDKKLTEKKLTKKSSKTIISKLTSLDDEDEDAFTSTPDREKNEKRELIDKIKDLESKIKIKKQKVDNLNRASVYKSKHNIGELKQLSETWRKGCILGLHELLLKLQSHGPMDMQTLLRSLRIPDEMVTRIFVNVNLN